MTNMKNKNLFFQALLRTLKYYNISTKRFKELVSKDICEMPFPHKLVPFVCSSHNGMFRQCNNTYCKIILPYYYYTLMTLSKRYNFVMPSYEQFKHAIDMNSLVTRLMSLNKSMLISNIHIFLYRTYSTCI